MIQPLYFGIFVLMGLAISYDDWRHSKIRNRWISCGLLACAGAWGFLFLNTCLGARGIRFHGLGEYYLPWRYYPAVATHLLLSAAAALSLWRWATWPAGDAKLFILCSFFLVIIDPNLPGFPLVSFLVLLINIFVPAGLVLAGELLLRGLSRFPRLSRAEVVLKLASAADCARVRLKEEWPRRAQYLALGVNLFAAFFLLQLAGSRFSQLALGPLGRLVLYLLMIVSWGRIAAVLRRRRVGAGAIMLVAAASGVAAFVFQVDLAGRVAAGLRMTLNFGLLLVLVRGILNYFMERESLRALDAEELRAGVILSDETWGKLMADSSLTERLSGAGRTRDGLSAEEAGVLKAWLASEAGGRAQKAAQLSFYQTIPFAVWIFSGSLVTLACRGTVIAVLSRGWPAGVSALRTWARAIL